MSPRVDRADSGPHGTITYIDPSFEHEISWFGWTFIGAMAAGGGYEGYRSNMALRWRGWERPPELKPGGNTALGVLAGLTSGFLLTYLMSRGSESVTTDNAAEWLEGINDRMTLLPMTRSYPGMPLRSISAIARDADARYTIRSIDDARFFLATFPGSPYRDGALAAFVWQSSGDTLLALAQVVRGLPAEELAITRWIEGLRTFDQAIAGVGIGAVGEHRPVLARRASELAGTLGDLRRFIGVFPGSPLIAPLAVRIGSGVTREEIPALLDLVPAIESRPDLLSRYLRGSTSTEDAITTMRRYPETRPEADRRAASLARSLDDYRAYVDAFPDGLSAQEMRRKIDAAERARKEMEYYDEGSDGDE